MGSSASHWDDIFAKIENTKLGWYEANTNQTNLLLTQIPEWQTATIFISGVGTSLIIDELLGKKIN